MNDKITKKCKEKGFCCPYAYFTKQVGKTHKRVARDLDVSVATIRYNRKRLEESQLKCTSEDDCIILITKELEKDEEE